MPDLIRHPESFEDTRFPLKPALDLIGSENDELAVETHLNTDSI
jgi:hypothetical protein